MNKSIIGPKEILYSNKLTDGEKVVYLTFENNLYPHTPAKNCSILSNKELAKLLKTTEKSIAKRIASLKNKKFIHSKYNNHLKRRYTYLDAPWQPTLPDEELPTEKELEAKDRQYQERGGYIYPEWPMDIRALMLMIQKTFNIPRFSSTPQTPEQKEFVRLFKQKFPNKAINCNVADYPVINYMKLIQEIENSTLLKNAGNLTLKWCMDHRDDILNGNYRKISNALDQIKNENFQGRSYADLDINSLFQNIDDIQI